MPQPSSPGWTPPSTLSSSISVEALERLPSSSWSRCNAKVLGILSSRTRAARKQGRPSRRLSENQSLVGAHLREACVKSRQRQWLLAVSSASWVARA